METIDISAVLNEQGYLLQKIDSKTLIRKKSASGSVIFVLFMIAGASLLTFGLYYGFTTQLCFQGHFSSEYPSFTNGGSTRTRLKSTQQIKN